MKELLKTIGAIIMSWNFATPIGETIYGKAINFLGVDASPNDLAPDELGCAESVSTILSQCFPFPILLSTKLLHEHLEKDNNWVKVAKPRRGDVIISPTGMGGPTIKNGHTGIMLDSYRIMSNSSSTGTWQQNYNLDSWKKRWYEYPVFFYRKLV